MYYIFNIHLIEVLKVYSPSKASWKCNLAKLQMLMKHKNDFFNEKGECIIDISLDIDPCIYARLITAKDLQTNTKEFTVEHSLKKIYIPKNFSISKVYEQIILDNETITTDHESTNISTPINLWVFSDINNVRPKILNICDKSTLFQHKEYFIKKDFYVFLETQTSYQINFENEALAPDPNIIFIKEKTDQGFTFHGSITREKNDGLKSVRAKTANLLERNKEEGDNSVIYITVDDKMENQTKELLPLLGKHSDPDNCEYNVTGEHQIRSYQKDLFEYHKQKLKQKRQEADKGIEKSSTPRNATKSAQNPNQASWSISNPSGKKRSKFRLALKTFMVNLARPTDQRNQPIPRKIKVDPTKVQSGPKQGGNMKVGLRMKDGGKSCCKSGCCTKCFTQ